jgi:electron transfer flavoprotein alpha subunit
MAEVLVLVKATDGVVAKVSLEALTLARVWGQVSAVVVGAPGSAAAVAQRLGEYGASVVYAAEADEFDTYPVTSRVAALAQLVASQAPAGVVIGSTQEGKEIAGRLAVRLDNGVLLDVVDLAADASATQAIFAGTTLVTAKITRGLPLVTVRPSSITPTPAPTPAAASVVPITVELSDVDRLATVTARHAETRSARPELAEASIVVSGGRGVGSADNFALVEQLADLLGAAVGASRAAVDSGFYPHQYQVGQTGKTVSPQLYIALGISGAIQHRAGMQTSKTIIAVNKDPEAPIFELTDLGIVGDLFTVVPQAIEEIHKRA